MAGKYLEAVIFYSFLGSRKLFVLHRFTALSTLLYRYLFTTFQTASTSISFLSLFRKPICNQLLLRFILHAIKEFYTILSYPNLAIRSLSLLEILFLFQNLLIKHPSVFLRETFLT